jgi:geranylgeranyl diphosphate synthase type II
MIEENYSNKKTDLWQYVEKHKLQIEKSLREHLPLAPPQIETKFNEAVRYALFSGGKRLRPVLTLLGAELFGGKPETVLPSGAAVEFIHTSSLIFDDLPCMDNADVRRGKTSLHGHFGEGLAVLVALGFLNASYHLVFVNHKNVPQRAIRAHAEIVECVGASGMLCGQSIDLALAKGASVDSVGEDIYKFESVRNLKTSALIRLALRVGAILSGANSAELANLSRFAALLGDAYQLGDDLIDLEEDGEIFSENKTFAINQGKSNAQLQLKNLTEQAKLVLTDNFKSSQARNCLIQLTDYLAERKF